MKRFNELSFLNHLYVVDLGADKIIESKIKSVERFTIFRNLFEKLGFDGDFNMNNLDSKIDLMYVGMESKLGIISTIISYYKRRYINNEYSLENLSVRGPFEEILRLELNNYLSSFDNFTDKSNDYKKQGLRLLIFLVYRYRNNLFHGSKNPYYLGHQNQNFNVANKMLSLCIGYFVHQNI